MQKEELEIDRYCICCGDVLPTIAEHDKHYAICREGNEINMSEDDIFNAIHNPNNY